MNYNEIRKNLEVFSLGDAQLLGGAQPGHQGNPSQAVSGRGRGRGRKDIHQAHEGRPEWEIAGAHRAGKMKGERGRHGRALGRHLQGGQLPGSQAREVCREGWRGRSQDGEVTEGKEGGVVSQGKDSLV